MAKAKSSRSSNQAPPVVPTPDGTANKADVDQPPRLSFPVVGIGASAGGLEALIEFFKAMPADSHMAFVVIQHLPPERESLLAGILAKHTAMPVTQVSDGLAVKGDHVYVIRPGHTLTINDGLLHLGEPVEKPGHRCPVDDFFRSLAEEQRERAICVIMSGMGTNGTAGARYIKAVGGVCIAQDPESAKSPSMPRALIEAGFADFVLRPEEIPDILIHYGTQPYARGVPPADTEEEQRAFNALVALLRARLHHDFSGYKRPTMLRRIQRRLGLLKVATIDEYVRILRQNPAEVTALGDDLMIHVTGFFRDPDVWEALRVRFIEPLVASREPGAPIRAWIAACSSGEEAYTVAILLVEAAEAAGKEFDIKIFATDIAERSLAQARAGVFPGGIESEVSPGRLARFFEREAGGGYRVKKKLRELVVFAPQNLLQDPPYSRLDLCTCRNLLIYLEPEIQRRALLLMHFALREEGVLLLGSSETIAGAEDLFLPIEKKYKIFRRIGSTRHGAVEFPLPRLPGGAGGIGGFTRPQSSVARQAERSLLNRFTPPSVVIDQQQHIVHFHGNTERYLDQPRGEPTRELLSLVREPLLGAARSALHSALTDGGSASARSRWNDTPLNRTCVEVVVSRLEMGDSSRYYLVSFVEESEPLPGDGGPAPNSQESRLRLESELKRVGDELRSTVAKLQSSNEELRAANEETTSINEELQSTNEELETSKEELQSLNEELTAVNSQLQLKMEELESTSSDLISLLANTEIAVVFLDLKLHIRRFTPSIADLLDLIPSDTGRPLAALAQKFTDPDFLKDVQHVATTGERLEKEVTSHAGRIYLRRTLPYRSHDNHFDGVVITFIDITRLKKAENSLHENEQRYRLILEGIKDYAIFLLDGAGRITTWPVGAQHVFGYTADEAIGQPGAFLYPEEIRTASGPADDLVRARSTGSIVQEQWHVRKDGSKFWSDGVLSTLAGDAGRVHGFVKILRDNTNQKLSAEALKEAKREAEAANAAKDHFLATVSHELRTPLTPMLLWAQILDREQSPDRALLHEGLEMIRKCAEEQHELIEDLIDTSRIVTGKLRLEPKPTDMLVVAQTAVDLVRPTATFKGLTLQASLDPDVGTVVADPGRLQQVIANLLNNAVKFTPGGGEVTLTTRRQGDLVEIKVTDNGIGISPEFLPRIFSRFGQAEESTARVASGLGLGLSIARQLVELHLGTIAAESAGLGRGASFVVKLPLAAIKPSPAPASEAPGSATGANLKGLQVLLVEDMEMSRQALTLALREVGAEVVAVTTAASALEEFKRRRPNVILSDIGMPHMSGHELIREIRKFERARQLPPVPAVALTAYADEKNRHQALENGFDDCLTKPIDQDKLIAALTTARKPEKDS